MKSVNPKQSTQKSLFLLLGAFCLSGLSWTVAPDRAVAQSTAEAPSAQQPKPTLRGLLETVPTRPIEPTIPNMPAEASAGDLLPSTDAFSTDAQSQEVKLLLRLSERRVYVYRGNSVEVSYPVAIGRPGWETPTGEFEVFHQIVDPGWTNPLTGDVMTPGPDNPLGDRWIAFWTDGTNSIGFHGTPNRDSVGQAASHGCIRMYNEDVRELYEIVSVGTPVTVEL